MSLGIASLLFVACGGGGGSTSPPSFGPETVPGQDQQTAITTAETDLIQLATVDINNGGPSVGFAALELALTLPGVITPDASSTPVQGHAGVAVVDPRIPAVMQVLGRASVDPCVVVTSGRIVFDKCTQDGIAIDGTISWGTGMVEVDIHASGLVDDVTADVTITAAMKVSASAIAGDITVDASANTPSGSASETLHSQIDVQVAQSCISSGTLTVTGSGSGAGAVNGSVQVVWKGCHVARVRYSTSA